MSRLEELSAAAREAQRNADVVAVERIARELADVAVQSGEPIVEANALAYLGGALVARNDGRGAREAFERSRAIMEEAGDEAGVVRALSGLGVVALDIELDAAAARAYLDVALAAARRIDDPRGLGQVLGNLAEVQRYEADYRGEEYPATRPRPSACGELT